MNRRSVSRWIAFAVIAMLAPMVGACAVRAELDSGSVAVAAHALQEASSVDSGSVAVAAHALQEASSEMDKLAIRLREDLQYAADVDDAMRSRDGERLEELIGLLLPPVMTDEEREGSGDARVRAVLADCGVEFVMERCERKGDLLGGPGDEVYEYCTLVNAKVCGYREDNKD